MEVITGLTPDQIEQRLMADEAIVASARARQARWLAEADRMQLPTGDGCRTLAEWTASRLDVSPETAKNLVRLARTDHRQVAQRLETGEWSFDRTVESDRWVGAGAPEDHVVAESTRFDIAGLRSQTALRHRLTPQDEERVFDGRYVVTQRSLDRTTGRLWGQLPGADMDLVEQNLVETADSFPALPDGSRPTRPQRMADALVALTTGQHPSSRHDAEPAQAAAVSSTGDATTDGAAGATHPQHRLPTPTGTLSVFVDERTAHTSGGYTVGDSVIDQLLCDGLVEYTALLNDGAAVEVGGRQTVTDRQRRRIFHRDKTCGADACTSRYRIQIHHRTFASHGGTNHDDNLVLVCWFHHHVVIHRFGFTIDPDSPPGRLRFTKPNAPPQRE